MNRPIRKVLSDAIQMKYPTVASKDLVFLEANRRRLTQPVNCHIMIQLSCIERADREGK